MFVPMVLVLYSLCFDVLAVFLAVASWCCSCGAWEDTTLGMSSGALFLVATTEVFLAE